MLARSASSLKLFALLLGLVLLMPAFALAEEEPAPDSPATSSDTEPKLASLNGTIGAFGLIGAHFGESLTQGGEAGRWLDFGGGAEIGLASKKGRLAGRIRFAYYGAQDLDAGLRHNGVLSAGLSIQLLKDVQRKFGAYALVDMGVSPLVTELRVFVFADVGAGVRYRPVDRLELFAEVTAFLRFEKTMAAGPLVFLGARFRL